jgi:hypothetical protein
VHLPRLAEVDTGWLTKALFGLGAVAGVAFILVGIAGGVWPGHWDDAPASDQILWIVFGVGGGVAVLAGLRLLQRSPWGGATLVSLGAIAGALPIFWALLPVLVAIALVVLSVLYARRAGRPREPVGA